MRSQDTASIIEVPVVQQAATVVAAAVRTALLEALRAAETCRCRRCRSEAVRTFDWAVSMLDANNAARG
jgi:hypothetical protein